MDRVRRQDEGVVDGRVLDTKESVDTEHFKVMKLAKLNGSVHLGGFDQITIPSALNLETLQLSQRLYRLVGMSGIYLDFCDAEKAQGLCTRGDEVIPKNFRELQSRRWSVLRHPRVDSQYLQVLTER